MQETRITLEIKGIEKVKDLIRTAYAQMHELEDTIDRIKGQTLEIQAKINQRPELTVRSDETRKAVCDVNCQKNCLDQDNVVILKKGKPATPEQFAEAILEYCEAAGYTIGEVIKMELRISSAVTRNMDKNKQIKFNASDI